MRRLPILLFVAASQIAWAGGVPTETLDPGLWAAASTGGFRALVFRECSPEHCWTRLYVQAETPEASSTQFRCTSEVKELGYGSVISDISWKPPADAKRLETKLKAKVSASHGGLEPYEATITVGSDCEYKIDPPRPAV